MAVNDINAVNFRGKAKATQKASGKPTKEAIKAGMMGGFGAFGQTNDFGGTDWGNWGGNWGQDGSAPAPPGDPWGGGNWQNDFDFGNQGWGQDNWGDDGFSDQGGNGGGGGGGHASLRDLSPEKKAGSVTTGQPSDKKKEAPSQPAPDEAKKKEPRPR